MGEAKKIGQAWKNSAKGRAATEEEARTVLVSEEPADKCRPARSFALDALREIAARAKAVK